MNLTYLACRDSVEWRKSEDEDYRDNTQFYIFALFDRLRVHDAGVRDFV